MAPLANQECEACRVGAPQVTGDEQQQLLSEIPSWKIIEVDGIDRLQRQFGFHDFASALAFTNRVAELAERTHHHPAILTEWGGVTVSWWTHKIKGLHMNDFIMAAKTDQLIV